MRCPTHAIVACIMHNAVCPLSLVVYGLSFINLPFILFDFTFEYPMFRKINQITVKTRVGRKDLLDFALGYFRFRFPLWPRLTDERRKSNAPQDTGQLTPQALPLPHSLFPLSFLLPSWTSTESVITKAQLPV